MDVSELHLACMVLQRRCALQLAAQEFAGIGVIRYKLTVQNDLYRGACCLNSNVFQLPASFEARMVDGCNPKQRRSGAVN
jgi:hypothetical protein